MNCQQARSRLSPYLDSELDAGTTFAISEHLRGCDGCRGRFEAEREVERLVATRLQSVHVPNALWDEIVRPIRQRSFSRWRLYVPLATAAAVLIVTWTGWTLSRRERIQPHWVVQEFLAETDGGQPFATSSPRVNSAGMTMPLEPFADLVVSLAGEYALNHVVQMVRLDTKADEDGAEFVELRLNCCGEPVLLRAARRDHPGRMREFIGADSSKLASLPTTDKVTITEREVGDYVVVAVSRHPVSQLLSGIRIQ
ncbi:MAG: zf-HC2 domain-containing protein [Planctomycetia bacterium]|nr:zf-HC2 domain-containing protein [Planctomycetia bacterium]MCC7314688.1 zf-HC2 domain-containing protein [Planctomycetota bacterium]